MDDVISVRGSLEKADIEVIEESDVLVLKIVNKPEEIGCIYRRLADAWVNIDFFYVLSRNNTG